MTTKKESDEKIRNCIGVCLTDANEQRFKDYNTSLKDCLAWLEKQGKHTNPFEFELSNSSIWSEGRPIHDGIYLVAWRGSRCLYHRGKATGYAVERVVDGHFYLVESEDLSSKQWVLIKKEN